MARISVNPDEAYQPVEHQSEEEHTHDEMLQSGEGFEDHRGHADKRPQSGVPAPAPSPALLRHRRARDATAIRLLQFFQDVLGGCLTVSSTRKSGIAFNARSRSSLD